MPRTSRSSGQSTSSTRPVRRARIAGHLATTPAVGDTISCDSVPGSAFGSGRILRHRRERDEDLVVVGPAVVAVLILRRRLADDREGHAVDRRSVSPIGCARAEQLLGSSPSRSSATRRASRLVLPVEVAAVLQLDGADRPGTAARCRATRDGGRVVAALHLHAAAFDLRADDGDQPRLAPQCARASSTVRRIDAAGALAAGLHAGAAAPDDADVPAELAQHLRRCRAGSLRPWPTGRRSRSMPQRMPNIVRKLRSLLARRFSSDWRMASRMGARPACRAYRGQNDLVARLHAGEDCDLRAVADAELHRHAAAAGLGAGVEQIDEGVLAARRR